jgi:hypothetical protein
MDRETFSKTRIAIPSKRLQAIHKVCFCLGDIEWVPSKLGGADVNFRVDGEKIGFELLVVSKSISMSESKTTLTSGLFGRAVKPW